MKEKTSSVPKKAVPKQRKNLRPAAASPGRHEAKCTICKHPQREEIEQRALVDDALRGLEGLIDRAFDRAVQPLLPETRRRLRALLAQSSAGAPPLDKRQSQRSHAPRPDRKSTRLNSSHRCISYSIFW